MIKPHILGTGTHVILNQRFSGGQSSSPQTRSCGKASACSRRRGESSLAGAQQEAIFFPQKHRNMADFKPLLNHRANLDQQFLLIEYSGSLASDGVDDLKMTGALALQ